MEPAIRALLKDKSRMLAKVLAERVGWSGSPAWFRENVARIRPEYVPADPADWISYEPRIRRSATCGFPRCGNRFVAESSPVLPVLVTVSSQFAVHHGPMIPSRMTGDLLAGMWQLIGSLVALPRRLI